MHTAPYWAMAHLTCYHCRITCVVCRKIEFLQVVTPRTVPSLRGSLLTRPLQTEYFKPISKQITSQALPHKG